MPKQEEELYEALVGSMKDVAGTHSVEQVLKCTNDLIEAMEGTKEKRNVLRVTNSKQEQLSHMRKSMGMFKGTGCDCRTILFVFLTPLLERTLPSGVMVFAYDKLYQGEVVGVISTTDKRGWTTILTERDEKMAVPNVYIRLLAEDIQIDTKTMRASRNVRFSSVTDLRNDGTDLMSACVDLVSIAAKTRDYCDDLVLGFGEIKNEVQKLQGLTLVFPFLFL